MTALRNSCSPAKAKPHGADNSSSPRNQAKKKKRSKENVDQTMDCRRRQFGLYDQLMVELRNEDQMAFKNFMRMPSEMFDELLTRVGPKITKHNTCTTYRDALDPGLKLALTLRHLASVTKYHSRSYGWSVPYNTMSLFIPEVCEAIIIRVQG